MRDGNGASPIADTLVRGPGMPSRMAILDRSCDRRRVLRGMIAAGGGAALTGLGSSAGGGRARAQDATPTDQGAAYAAEVDAGLAYFRGRASEQRALADALLAAIQRGDLATAKTAYVAARPPYEEIEVLAASFPETDAAIDARPYSIDGGETSADFVGFHRIEALLFRDGNLAAAVPYGEGLVGSSQQLEIDLARREAFDATLHFEGMIALATEVAAKKISREEETWSDQSLLIFHYNWRGIGRQFEPFAPALARTDAAAATEVEAALEAVMATLAAYPPALDGGFPPYSSVPTAARAEIGRASYRLRDALIQAAATLGLAS